MLAFAAVLLLPPDVAAVAERLSASLPEAASQGLRLDAQHLPHVTLVQQFIDTADLDAALDAANGVVAARRPLALRVTGGARANAAAWMALERTLSIVHLHEDLMRALEPFARDGGGAQAFAGGNARPRDVAWVSGYRRDAAWDAYAPHVTLGHAPAAPVIEPFAFEATEVAACQLGRFCSCRRVLRSWRLA